MSSEYQIYLIKMATTASYYLYMMSCGLMDAEMPVHTSQQLDKLATDLETIIDHAEHQLFGCCL